MIALILANHVSTFLDSYCILRTTQNSEANMLDNEDIIIHDIAMLNIINFLFFYATR